jgi:hypothetical protein
MQPIPLSKANQRIFRLCFVFLMISSFVILFIGTSVRSVHTDIKALNSFLEAASEVQPNFENSLQLYTENTEQAIAFVHELRPDDELDYIQFISELEAIAQELGLSLELESFEDPNNTGDTLNYNISFYSSRNDLTEFLYRLEQLPYYLRIDQVRYQTLSSLQGSQDPTPNATVTIQLYVK